ncbi:hypothetical protein ACFLTA_08605 [Bacteroidota bacterium]
MYTLTFKKTKAKNYSRALKIAQELEKELKLCRNKIRELEGVKRALEQEVVLLINELQEDSETNYIRD